MAVVVVESNLRAVADRLTASAIAIPGLLTASAEAAGLAVQTVAETSIHDATPVDTGALRDSTYSERVATGPAQIIGIGQRDTIDWKGQAVPLSTLLTLGTRPHDIYPLNKKALFWEGAEHPVGMVHHPGTQPNPYVRDAMAAAAAPIELILRETGQVALIHVLGSLT